MKTKPKIEIDLAEVERLASLGATEKQIAAALGMCEKAFWNRKRKGADLVNAIKRGQAKGIGAFAVAFFKNTP